MPLWNKKARTIPPDLLGKMTPIEVLYDFDWPITFTFECELGHFLAHLVSVGDGLRKHVAVPAKIADVDRLKSGAVSMRMAFDQPLVWVLTCDSDWAITSSATVPGIEYLPTGAIPADGVMLYPDLEPLLRIRILGVMDDGGLVAAELLRSVVARVQKMMRNLAELANPGIQFDSLGLLSEMLKLRTQQVAFRSLEVAFREPDRAHIESRAESESELQAAYEIFSITRKLLNEGLEVAMGREINVTIGDLDIESQRRLLGAVKQLAPTGTEDEVELSGRMLDTGSSRHIVLSRDNSRRIDKQMRRLRNASLMSIIDDGVIDEFDYGFLHFTLRNTNSGEERQFRYGLAKREEVFAHFESRKRVHVSGSRKIGDNIIELADIYPAE